MDNQDPQRQVALRNHQPNARSKVDMTACHIHCDPQAVSAPGPVLAQPPAPVAQVARPLTQATQSHGPQFRTWPEEGTCLGEETTTVSHC